MLDVHQEAKDAFTSLWVFDEPAPGHHVQVQPVSRCHLANRPPPSKPPVPGKLKLKQPKPLTVGCPVDVDGYPIDNPYVHPVAPAFQPETAGSSTTQARKAARFQVQITFGGKL